MFLEKQSFKQNMSVSDDLIPKDKKDKFPKASV